eukprot:COSAG06_NODE_13367_length_1264_cov_1.251502_2_plen_206_part_01
MDYAGSVVNYLILATAVVAGVFTSHAEVIVAIAQGSGFMLMIIFGFSQIVDVSSPISALAGYVTRITAMLDACAEADVCVQLNRKGEEDAGRRVVLHTQRSAAAAGSSASSPAGLSSSTLLECRGLVVGRAESAMAGLPRGGHTDEQRSGARGQLQLSKAPQQPGISVAAAAAALTPPISFVLERGGSLLLMGPSGAFERARERR